MRHKREKQTHIRKQRSRDRHINTHTDARTHADNPAA